MAGPGPYAIVDLGGTHTELVVVADGEPVFARTLSRGVAGATGIPLGLLVMLAFYGSVLRRAAHDHANASHLRQLAKA